MKQPVKFDFPIPESQRAANPTKVPIKKGIEAANRVANRLLIGDEIRVEAQGSRRISSRLAAISKPISNVKATADGTVSGISKISRGTRFRNPNKTQLSEPINQLTDAEVIAILSKSISGLKTVSTQMLWSWLDTDDVEGLYRGALTVEELHCYAMSRGRHSDGFKPENTKPYPCDESGVRCVDCHHFTKDTIGDGTGIGDCAVNAPQSQTLYPSRLRYCQEFRIGLDNNGIKKFMTSKIHGVEASVDYLISQNPFRGNYETTNTRRSHRDGRKLTRS